MKSTSLDKIAISLSAVCLLHCLLTPAAITLLPILTLSAAAEEFLFHQLLLWLVIPVSTAALFIGCRKHRSALIVLTGILGMGILVYVSLWGHDQLGVQWERIVTSIAGIVLATSHFLNYRACQKTLCDDSDCSSKHHH